MQMLLASNSAQVYVPRQTTWPAHFVAEVQLGSPQQPFREYLVFTRGGFAVPWKVAFAAGAQLKGPQAIDVGAQDKDGYTISLPVHIQDSVSRLPATLAAAYQTAKETMRPTVPPQFAPGAWTSDFLNKVVQTPQGGRVGDSGPNLTVHYFTYPADTVVAVPLTGGRTLACGVVRQTAVYTAPHGWLVQDSAQRSWAPTLPAGRYRNVTATGQLQTCFFVTQVADAPIVVSAATRQREVVCGHQVTLAALSRELDRNGGPDTVMCVLSTAIPARVEPPRAAETGTSLKCALGSPIPVGGRFASPPDIGDGTAQRKVGVSWIEDRSWLHVRRIPVVAARP